MAEQKHDTPAAAGGGGGGTSAAGPSLSPAAAPLERGHCYFLFRPKVGVEQAHSLKEVQKLYLWLSPEKVKLADHATHPLGVALDASSAERRRAQRRPLAPEAKSIHAKHRLLVIPHKKLPSAPRHPHWAFVDAVGEVSDIQANLGEIETHTKTRGDRTTHAARIVAEGLYEIAREGNHTYLFYDLELPQELTEVQHAFHIEKEGLFLVQAKNPHADATSREGTPTAGLSKAEHPQYPPALQAEFKGKRVPEVKFAAMHPEMLNYKGTELLLLGVKATPESVLGHDEVEFMEQCAELAAKNMQESEEKTLKEVSGLTTEPALKSW